MLTSPQYHALTAYVAVLSGPPPHWSSSCRERHWSASWTPPAVTAAIAIALLSYGGYSLYKTDQLERDGVNAKGTVLATNLGKGRLNYGDLTVTYGFTDQAGKAHEGRANLGRGSSNVQSGSRVQVLYNPIDPSWSTFDVNALRREGKQMAFVGSLLSVLALILAGMTVFNRMSTR